MLAMPSAILAWLTERVEGSWPEPAPVVDKLPRAMPEGRVQRLAGGGPYGLMFDGRLDRHHGRVALEVLENSRMAGEVYFRIWEDGTVEPLEPAPWIAYADGDEAAYFEHNRIAYAHLRERGFLQG